MPSKPMTEPLAIRFIERYAELIGAAPSPEQALLLKYFTLAGDELPVSDNRAWFYSAWRKVDIISTRHPLCSRDMVVWHLIHVEPVVDQVVNELLPEASKHAF
ncbi:hypothetical protein EU642_22345 [Salmonella enterica]|nr:hypothetical protein [Salmonella enterica]EAO0118595.1 hypothetical protein [Salmonella enterica]EAO3601698.1 hypothetical protein [Salmonella enterica]EAR6391593.1 hypothetical protein [Salmonella enterica]EAV1285357.1 hypothetical protein [Salmonella enterica]